MPGKTGSRRRKGSRGPCSYCGKVHRKGRRHGNSCRRKNFTDTPAPAKR